jgi:hypothetical protein
MGVVYACALSFMSKYLYQSCGPKPMTRVDINDNNQSSIFKHEIRTYLDDKPVQQRLRDVNPQKAPTIKAEVEKLLNASFIYPVPLTEWVSNPILVDKKQGTIHVCMYFHDLNKAFPKDNFPTPFIGQIFDKCAGSEVFSFKDGFFRI